MQCAVATEEFRGAEAVEQEMYIAARKGDQFPGPACPEFELRREWRPMQQTSFDKRLDGLPEAVAVQPARMVAAEDSAHLMHPVVRLWRCVFPFGIGLEDHVCVPCELFASWQTEDASVVLRQAAIGVPIMGRSLVRDNLRGGNGFSSVVAGVTWSPDDKHLQPVALDPTQRFLVDHTGPFPAHWSAGRYQQDDTHLALGGVEGVAKFTGVIGQIMQGLPSIADVAFLIGFVRRRDEFFERVSK